MSMKDTLKKAKIAAMKAKDKAKLNPINLTLADIISDGEEFSCNQTKSTNGGNPMPYDCFDDSYEMFLLSL